MAKLPCVHGAAPDEICSDCFKLHGEDESGALRDTASIDKMAEVEPMMQFFGFAHLPVHLRTTSERFAVLAFDLCLTLPRNPERTVALRKLLEAKDCAVRAWIWKSPKG
jgi:hypothetical protein